MAQSVTETVEAMQQFADVEVSRDIEHALGEMNKERTGFWGGIERVLDWLRTKVARCIEFSLQKIPVIGRYASRIGNTTSSFIFTVAQMLIGFLRVVFSKKEVWQKAHAAAMLAWNANEEKGLLAQIYAYAKKMAGYILEIIKQCLERAINAKGLQVSEDEKSEISEMLDVLLHQV